ncbi:serine protease 30-like [Littorina saxatilis]|uniref:serine protease 30-like n=1 Tax=Littorina saxatilis TaxID=31220 RepID=UPI0038B67C2F
MFSRIMVVLIVLTAIVLIVGTSFTIYNITLFPEKSFFDEAMVSLCDSSTASQSQTEIPGRQSIYEGKLVPSIADYPWMVYLRIRTTRQSGSYKYLACGATLIDDRHLLTAAHCVSSLDFKDGFLQYKERGEITARLGSISKDHPMTVKTIESAFMHIAFRRFVKGARWEENSGHRDIAVLRLSESLLDSPGWNTKIKPACLPTATEVTPRSCVVMGWGQFAKDQLPTSLIMKDIQMINYTQCAKMYLSAYNETAQKSIIKQNYEDSLICTRGADICPGDSGGPLLCKTNTSPELKVFGIASSASPGGCGATSIPNAYISVPFFRSWLQYVALPALRNGKSSAAWLACLKQKCLDFGYVYLVKSSTDLRIKEYVTSWICRLFPPYYFCTFLDPKPERCQTTVVPKAINILSETPTRSVIGRNGEKEPVYDPINGIVRKQVIDSLKEITRGVSDLDTCTQ